MTAKKTTPKKAANCGESVSDGYSGVITSGIWSLQVCVNRADLS